MKKKKKQKNIKFLFQNHLIEIYKQRKMDGAIQEKIKQEFNVLKLKIYINVCLEIYILLERCV